MDFDCLRLLGRCIDRNPFAGHSKNQTAGSVAACDDRRISLSGSRWYFSDFCIGKRISTNAHELVSNIRVHRFDLRAELLHQPDQGRDESEEVDNMNGTRDSSRAL